MYSHKQKQGFTLIELLVVIAIIGILSAIGLTALGSSQAKARDAKRKSDLNSLSVSLGIYLNENTTFPKAIPDALLAPLPEDQGPKWLGDVNSTVASQLTGSNVAIPKAPQIGAVATAKDYWYVTNDIASLFALFSKTEAGGEWFVVNSKGWSDSVDGSDAVTDNPAISTTECLDSASGSLEFSPCAAQPRIQ